MKRRAVKLVVFLLLGAIVNVAVAWGCAAWLSVARAREAFPYAACRSSDEVPCWAVNWVHRPGATRYVFQAVSERSQYDVVDSTVIPHWSRVHSIRLPQHDDYCPIVVEDARGFPMHSLKCEFLLAETDSVMPWATEVEGGIPIDQANWPSMPTAGSIFIRSPFLYAQALPLDPIWPGFAINSIFYAAVLWMMFAMPGVVRRRRRIRRGLCPACAYPVGSSPVCTECGGPVKRSEVSGQKSEDVQT